MAEIVESPHYTPTPLVQHAIQNAQLLLTHAARSQTSLERAVVETLVDAKDIFARDAWTPEYEVTFWKAFTKINDAVKPATIKSLKTAYPSTSKFFRFNPLTKSQVFIHIYVSATVLAMIGLIAIQIYWMIGAGIVNRIEELTQKQQELSNAEKIAQIQTEKVEPNQEQALQDKQSVKDQLAKIRQEIETNYTGLLQWSKVWQSFFLLKETTFKGKNVIYDQNIIQQEVLLLQRKIEADKLQLERGVEEKQRVVTQKRIEENEREQKILQQKLTGEKEFYARIIIKNPSIFVLEFLQSYILPLLYGLLGAAIYVIRSLTSEIDRMVYETGDDIEYGLRLALGALGGVGIGWFLTPEDLSGLKSISPLAISFVVGYNIDLLFSVMDQLIATISQRMSSPELAPPVDVKKS